MADEELDKQLKEFLVQENKNKAKGYTVANLIIKVEQALVNQRSIDSTIESHTNLIDRTRKDVRRHDDDLRRHGRDIKQIKDKLEFQGEPNTGSYELALIEKELDRQREKERTNSNPHLTRLELEVERQRLAREADEKSEKEDKVWWKRQIIGWIVAAVGVIILNIIVALVAVAFANAGKH